MTSTPTQTALNELRRRLRALFAMHATGAGHALLRARAEVDGYLAALIDAGIAPEQQLLQLVTEERRRQHGPGSGAFTRDETRAENGAAVSEPRRSLASVA